MRLSAAHQLATCSLVHAVASGVTSVICCARVRARYKKKRKKESGARKMSGVYICSSADSKLINHLRWCSTVNPRLCLCLGGNALPFLSANWEDLRSASPSYSAEQRLGEQRGEGETKATSRKWMEGGLRHMSGETNGERRTGVLSPSWHRMSVCSLRFFGQSLCSGIISV